MPSLKSLKLRIKSIKSTQKITKAMKMVAASKLRKARESAENAYQYVNQLESIIKLLEREAKSDLSSLPLLTGTGDDKVHLVIVAASDRGLCGAFNGSIIKAARQKIQRLESEGKIVKIICVGKKSHDLLKQNYSNRIIKNIEGLAKKGVTFHDALIVSEEVLERFERGEFDVCHIIFNKFKSAIQQVLTEQQLIPIHFEQKIVAEENEGLAPYEYEPSAEELLKELLPKNITVQIFRALLENNASEQGARMTAMDNATRNSGELIKKLTLVYNRSRQAQITRELIEIISGAEAI
jgi:F-type H+-transporting ATPase subunit gamma